MATLSDLQAQLDVQAQAIAALAQRVDALQQQTQASVAAADLDPVLATMQAQTAQLAAILAPPSA